MAKESAYKKAGVDIDKADRLVGSISQMVGRTLNSKVKKSIGGYAALYELSKSNYIAATTDGVGTKLKLAFELGKHDTIGIDLVAMSVNDLICVGATPLFFLDYFATGGLDLPTAKAVLRGVVRGCELGKLALIGGETAEMPGIYRKGEYDLAGFAVGTVSDKDLIDGSKVKAEDVILGIESSGPHSNGFSLIRKLLNLKSAKDRKVVSQAFVPTKIYVDSIRKLTAAVEVKGLAHITGSGFLNLPRINGSFDYEIFIPKKTNTAPFFEELQSRGKLSPHELYTTFNMGFGMVVVVDAKIASKAKRVLESSGEQVHFLGKVKKRKSKVSAVEVTGRNFEISLM